MRPFYIALAVLALPFGLRAKTYQAVRGESTLTYVLVHPLHVIRGVNKNFDCTVEMPEDPPQDFSRVRIHAVADVLGFNTGNSNRDSHAMEVVDAMRYPKVEFTGTAVGPEGHGYRVAGRLRFHGQEHPVSFVMIPTFAGRKVTLTGAFTVLLSDYGVPRPSLLLIPVHNEMQILIKAVAYRDSSASGS